MKICAVFDMQGFQVGHKFFPREFAIVTNTLKLCFEIVSDSINFQKRSGLEFQTNRIHGIPLKQVLSEDTKKVVREEDLIEFLNFMAEFVSTEGSCIAVKNQKLGELLEECNIPFCNLEKETIGNEVCPPLHTFDSFTAKISPYCALHYSLHRQNFDKDIRCALRKAVNIWEWVSQKYDSDFMYDMAMDNIVRKPEEEYKDI